ncbi:MauE/DoxX family redox-associated membrane protein [Gluconacetobacter azotocaptans]|nr:MauE/DoxX family redox-associated membrane protein [Gluconacetobacter azotocaptans]MBM9403404.1 methylamine utilization protein MauE [Gluconacetobacter azotocaptans]GBQ32071.1 hypothetical protein AA13594_2262 [Gluconacetobacter azotocaptans DSM 13594]
MEAADIAIDAAAAAAGWLLLVAGLGKLRDRAEWMRRLAAYRLVPVPLLDGAALAVVLLELGAGAALAGVVFPRVAGVTAALLFVVFALAMAVNLLRGRRDLDCACGGAPQPISWRKVVLDLLLAGFLAARAACAQPAWTPLPIAGGLLIFLLVSTAISLGGMASPRLAPRQDA